MSRKNRTIFLVSFFILLSAGFAFYYSTVLKETRSPNLGFWGDDVGPALRPFTFVNQLGDTVTEKDVKGKILVVEYFFATCMGICPKMNENMAKVYETYKNNDDILILSHTVDPLRDTVEALLEYSKKFGAKADKWMFLTGDKQALYNQARLSYKITATDQVAEDIDEDFIHEKFFVLVDKKGRLRAHPESDGSVSLYDGTDEQSVEQLIKDIKMLQSEN